MTCNKNTIISLIGFFICIIITVLLGLNGKEEIKSHPNGTKVVIVNSAIALTILISIFYFHYIRKQHNVCFAAAIMLFLAMVQAICFSFAGTIFFNRYFDNLCMLYIIVIIYMILWLIFGFIVLFIVLPSIIYADYCAKKNDHQDDERYLTYT